MISFDKLVVLSEASKGFIAAQKEEAPIDENIVEFENPYPNLTLNECMSLLTTSILETQLSLYKSEGQTNEALVEAAVNAISNKTEANYMPIYESAGEKLKEIANKAWEMMKNAAKAIVNWVKDLALKLKGTTDQLLDRQNIETYKAYKGNFDVTLRAGLLEDPGKWFKHADGSEEDVMDLFTAATKHINGFGGGATSTAISLFITKERAEWIKNAGKSTSPSDMEGFTAMELMNIPNDIDTLKPNWELEVRNSLFGEEKTFTYGKDLQFSTIENIIKDQKTLANIQKTYSTLIGDMQKTELEFTKAIEGLANGTEKVDTADLEAASDSDAIDSLNIFLRWYTGVINAINKVNKLHVAFVNERYAACAKVLRAILKAQGKEAFAAKVQAKKDEIAAKKAEKADAAKAKADQKSAEEVKDATNPEPEEEAKA